MKINVKQGDMSLVEWAVANEHPQVLGVLIDLHGDDEISI